MPICEKCGKNEAKGRFNVYEVMEGLFDLARGRLKRTEMLLCESCYAGMPNSRPVGRHKNNALFFEAIIRGHNRV